MALSLSGPPIRGKEYHKKTLSSIEVGNVIEVIGGQDFTQEEDDFFTHVRLRNKSFLLVRGIEVRPAQGNKWTKFKFTVKDIKTQLEFSFWCAKSDWAYEIHTDGDNWELIYG